MSNTIKPARNLQLRQVRSYRGVKGKSGYLIARLLGMPTPCVDQFYGPSRGVFGRP